MAKTLKVIDSFFVADVDDIFELSEDGKMYVCEHTEEYHKTDEASSKALDSSYSSKYCISVEFAKQLIEEGYLEEVKDKSTFVNIFDEIDALLAKYTLEYNEAELDIKNGANYTKLERRVVLSNLITLLQHLKGLKK